ncbi:MAG TPA: IMPACT family protein, partial [Massilia sp.]|nr:IMPACT family protein [Massilia sp.]
MAQTITAPVHHELLIKKSRFIACVQPMADRAGAQQVVAGLRAQHPGAAHVCWA